MKILSLVLMTIVFSSPVLAQEEVTEPSKADVYIGLDVLQSLPSYIFGKKYFIQNTLVIEPVIRFKAGAKARKYFLVSPGFTTGSTNKNTTEFISYEKFQGVYLRLGYEAENADIPGSIGFGPVISFTSFKGRYKFEGPVFGDYEGNFTDKNNVAVGINGFVTYNVKLHKKLFLRFLLQGTISARKGIINPYYYPGLGYTKGNATIMFSPGITAQLFYKVR